MLIMYDVDTEYDFISRFGALHVPGAEEIRPNLGRLEKYGKKYGIKRVGEVDRHFGTEEWKEFELELKKWGGPFGDHAKDGTWGQRKIKETYDADAIFIENTSPAQREEGVQLYSISDMDRIIASDRKIIFEKQSYSVFPTEQESGGNEYAAQFLQRMGVKKAIVFGVATDYCVKTAVLGMQQRGIHCYVVEDAISGITEEGSKSALEEMVHAGAEFVKTIDVLQGRLE